MPPMRGITDTVGVVTGAGQDWLGCGPARGGLQRVLLLVDVNPEKNRGPSSDFLTPTLFASVIPSYAGRTAPMLAQRSGHIGSVSKGAAKSARYTATLSRCELRREPWRSCVSSWPPWPVTLGLISDSFTLPRPWLSWKR